MNHQIKILKAVVPLVFLFTGCFAIYDLNLAKSYYYRITGNNLEWPCDSTKNIYMSTGRYLPKSIIATRCQIYKQTAFVALPRFKCGVPFSLGKICLKKNSCWASIEPWPAWSLQEEGKCEALQNVVDIYLDKQGILWVLDIGIVNTLEQPIKRCSPKIVGFDAITSRVVKIIDLGPLTTDCSRLQYLVADYSKQGECYIYVADAGDHAIIVYDVKLCKGYRVMLPAPCYSGCVKNDVLYIALVHKSCGATVLYFTFLGSKRLYCIRTEHLRQGKGSGAVIDIGPKPNDKQIVLLGTDNESSIFIRYKGESDIYMWCSDTVFKTENLIEIQKGGDCRLPTQVLPGFKNLIMWTIESDFHNYISNQCGGFGASVILHPVVREVDS